MQLSCVQWTVNIYHNGHHGCYLAVKKKNLKTQSTPLDPQLRTQIIYHQIEAFFIAFLIIYVERVSIYCK